MPLYRIECLGELVKWCREPKIRFVSFPLTTTSQFSYCYRSHTQASIVNRTILDKAEETSPHLLLSLLSSQLSSYRPLLASQPKSLARNHTPRQSLDYTNEFWLRCYQESARLVKSIEKIEFDDWLRGKELGTRGRRWRELSSPPTRSGIKIKHIDSTTQAPEDFIAFKLFQDERNSRSDSRFKMILYLTRRRVQQIAQDFFLVTRIVTLTQSSRLSAFVRPICFLSHRLLAYYSARKGVPPDTLPYNCCLGPVYLSASAFATIRFHSFSSVRLSRTSYLLLP